MHEERDSHRHPPGVRIAHWAWVLALLILVSSGLQIFDAAPYLDASDQTDPVHRLLAIGSPAPGVGVTVLFGHTYVTTGWLGWVPDGLGGESARAFPSWITIPAYQDLADGRRWHLLFAWIFGAAWALRMACLVRSKGLGTTYAMYEPLQRGAYAVTTFVLIPLAVATGLALSPGLDARFHWLPAIFGGRQFARTWHFATMIALCTFFAVHTFQILTHGPIRRLRSMITGR